MTRIPDDAYDALRSAVAAVIDALLAIRRNHIEEFVVHLNHNRSDVVWIQSTGNGVAVKTGAKDWHSHSLLSVPDLLWFAEHSRLIVHHVERFYAHREERMRIATVEALCAAEAASQIAAAAQH